MSSARGYRGYIASRPIRAGHLPQRLQNLLVRDYAQRNGLHYLLSATEYVMPSCYMVLEDVLSELPTLGGIIACSLFMLPERRERRRAIYDRILAAGCELHCALENVVLRVEEDVARCEDILGVAASLGSVPFGASMERVSKPAGPDAAIALLLRSHDLGFGQR